MRRPPIAGDSSRRCAAFAAIEAAIDLASHQDPLDILRSRFGFDAFRDGQRAVVDKLLSGKSVLAVFPTGGGKSLCYQLPALLLDGVTLVVSPLIALMKDQVDALRAKGVPAARLDSSLAGAEVRAVYDDLASGQLRLLYVAPERLGNERFLARLERTRIALLAVDEAHCISEWGHNFRPDYLKLARLAQELGVGRVLALTATATPAVAKDIRAGFGIAPEDHVQTAFHRPNLELVVTPCPGGERPARLRAALDAHPGPAIVYVTLQRTAEDVAAHLATAGIAAEAYHAGLDDDVRARVQDRFMSGTLRVVVATIAFGMGIDKADIRAVYHYNLPKTLESYVQEIGRAGRDGEASRCEVLACADDLVTLENFSYGDTPTRESIAALARELLEAGETFDVAQHELSVRHDMRPLVVSTALTYLELEGVLRHTGPFYTVFKLRFARPEEEVAGRFDPDRARFLRAVFAAGTRGTTWLTIEPAVVARAIGEPRLRIVRAIGYLEEQGDVEVEVSGVRLGYRRLRKADPAALADRLHALFATRETRDIERLGSVVALLERDACLVHELLRYFGEDGECRANGGRPCGRCAGTRAAPLPRTPPRMLDTDELALIRALATEGRPALNHPRQIARFLCGITSPATTRAKLTKDSRFGGLALAGFRAVLDAAAGCVRTDRPPLGTA